MPILLVVFLIFLIVWSICFCLFNDFSIPSHHPSHYQKVLVIFPHPDDEALNSGGLIRILCKKNSLVTGVILTKGENCIHNVKLKENIKGIRSEEANRVGRILGISKIIHEDFGDEKLTNQSRKLSKYIDNVVKKEKPSLVITYDLSGLYGHKDHMIVSQLVTNLIKKKYKSVELWYVSYPTKILDRIKLPEHRKNDQIFKALRSSPTHKIFLGKTLVRKVYSLSSYKSQRKSFQQAMPIKMLPFEFFYSFQLFEYYAKVN